MNAARSVAAGLLACAIAVTAIAAVTPGKATGNLVSNGEATPLDRAYVVEREKLVRIVLANADLDESALRSNEALAAARDAGGFTAIAIQLNEEGAAEETFFFADSVPAGLSVRELGRYEPKKGKTKPGSMAGRVVFKDDGFSFSYDVKFESAVTVIRDELEPLAAGASKEEHARWRLRQLELEFTPDGYRDVVVRGQAERVKLYIDAGMPADTQNALDEAVSRNDLATAKVLIAAGADPNVADDYGQSLVMEAASNGNAELIKLLAGAGADVSKPNDYKIAPLAAAAEQGHLDVVRELIAAGAKVNARNTYGGTALSIAVMRGYKEIVQTLLDAGADAKRDQKELLEYAKDNAEITAMIKAAAKKK